jgi:hypothetical protein
MFNITYFKEFVDGHKKFAVDLYKLSRDEKQNFPFALTIFEVCVKCLKKVRDCSLSDTFRKIRVMNKKQDKAISSSNPYAELYNKKWKYASNIYEMANHYNICFLMEFYDRWR